MDEATSVNFHQNLANNQDNSNSYATVSADLDSLQ
jgi:hypothetical protein